MFTKHCRELHSFLVYALRPAHDYFLLALISLSCNTREIRI